MVKKMNGSNGRTATAHAEQQERLEVSAEQQTWSEVVKRIRKLRWIGMEREAEALQATLCRMRRPDSVLGEPVGSKNSIRRSSGGNQIGT